jgi:hypothetical protein
MVDLRPLILITGTIRVDGGEKNRVRNEDSTRAGNSMKVVTDRTVSKDRRAANVIVTDYMRKLRGIVILRTPYGTLLDPARLDEFKKLMAGVLHKIVDYTNDERRTRLTNCVLWEKLVGQRQAAVAGWIAAELAQGNEEVRLALKDLTAPAAPKLKAV